MFDVKECKNCGQRRHGPEFTPQCPAYPMRGHDWELRGLRWNESLIGKLWKTKIGKILMLGFLGYIIIESFF